MPPDVDVSTVEGLRAFALYTQELERYVDKAQCALGRE